MTFQDGKMVMVDTLGLAKDALHVHVGLALFLGVAILLRRSLADWRVLAVVFVAALMGEALDLRETVHWPHGPPWSDHFHDIWNTVLWPAVLFLLARYTRVLKR